MNKAGQFSFSFSFSFFFFLLFGAVRQRGRLNKSNTNKLNKAQDMRYRERLWRVSIQHVSQASKDGNFLTLQQNIFSKKLLKSQLVTWVVQKQLFSILTHKGRTEVGNRISKLQEDREEESFEQDVEQLESSKVNSACLNNHASSGNGRRDCKG